MSLRLTNVTWEVILAAGMRIRLISDKPAQPSQGSYQTPQLLELSGIGNQDILSKHGISTLVDLPGVGENLRKLTALLFFSCASLAMQRTTLV